MQCVGRLLAPARGLQQHGPPQAPAPTRDGALDDRAVFELYLHRLVRQLHEEPEEGTAGPRCGCAVGRAGVPHAGSHSAAPRSAGRPMELTSRASPSWRSTTGPGAQAPLQPPGWVASADRSPPSRWIGAQIRVRRASGVGWGVAVTATTRRAVGALHCPQVWTQVLTVCRLQMRANGSSSHTRTSLRKDEVLQRGAGNWHLRAPSPREVGRGFPAPDRASRGAARR